MEGDALPQYSLSSGLMQCILVARGSFERRRKGRTHKYNVTEGARTYPAAVVGPTFNSSKRSSLVKNKRRNSQLHKALKSNRSILCGQNFS